MTLLLSILFERTSIRLQHIFFLQQAENAVTPVAFTALAAAGCQARPKRLHDYLSAQLEMRALCNFGILVESYRRQSSLECRNHRCRRWSMGAEKTSATNQLVLLSRPDFPGSFDCA